MQVVQFVTLLDTGHLGEVSGRIEEDLRAGIDHVRWPEGSDAFLINPQRRKNGVVPIKLGFMQVLLDRGWRGQAPYLTAEEIAAKVPGPGPIDAVFDLDQFGLPPFAVEWETGNVSSSHRALNKMAMGMTQGRLSGGALVIPIRALARYLTDRIGNYEELIPYFGFWPSVKIERGLLNVIAVAHDAENLSVPLIPKGTDGRALG